MLGALIPAGMAAVGGALGLVKGKGIGGGVSGLLGAENEFQAQPHQVDPNAFQYGGAPGGADEAAGRYRSGAEGAMAEANWDRQMAGLARGDQNAALGQQMGAVDLQRQAALGNAPSRAEILGRQQADMAAAAQQSLAASARGPAALALAQQNAAANTANAQTQIAGQAMAERANEMAMARQGYAQAAAAAQSGAGSIRGQDLQSQQGARQYALGMTQAEQNVRNTQLGASMNREQLQSNNVSAANSINAGVAGQNAGTNFNSSMGLIKMVGDGMSQSGSQPGGSPGGSPAGGAGLVGSLAGMMSAERSKVPLMASPGSAKVGADMGAFAAAMGGGRAGESMGQYGGYTGAESSNLPQGGPPAPPDEKENPYLKPGQFTPFGNAIAALPMLQTTMQPLIASPGPAKRPFIFDEPTSVPVPEYRTAAQIPERQSYGDAKSIAPYTGPPRGYQKDQYSDGDEMLQRMFAKGGDDSKSYERAQNLGQQRQAYTAASGRPAIETDSGKQFPQPKPDEMEKYLASTRGALYEYKDPGMPGANRGANYGPPAAEDMAKNPVGSVVTTMDPRTGMPAIETDKALKANMSAVSYVNDKTNELERMVNGLSARMPPDGPASLMMAMGRRR